MDKAAAAEQSQKVYKAIGGYTTLLLYTPYVRSWGSPYLCELERRFI